jgi:hypothetical protein
MGHVGNSERSPLEVVTISIACLMTNTDSAGFFAVAVFSGLALLSCILLFP